MEKKRSLFSAYPDVASEWHPTKNGMLTPNDVTPRSHHKVWWLGKCGHEWQADIASRTKGHGCPYCNNYAALAGYNDLATTNPELAKQWNYERNGSLKPTDVLAGSHKIVWWKCEKGHEWEKSVKDRSAGNGCPYCSNFKVIPGYNDLATTNPALVKEWNYERNGELRPENIVAGSEKKVWWKCDKGHEWQAIVYNRNKGVGCPICDGKIVLAGYNDLATTNPELAAQWNYEKNGDLKPTEVASGSHKKVWWRCLEGHEWLAVIKTRTSGTGCPYCSNKKVLTGYNDFKTVYPELSKEWSSKNTISASEVIRGGDKKYYWVCPLGHDDYLSSVDQRVRGQGCPICAQQSQTSFPEQALFFYIKQLFPDAINRYMCEKRELDIFIPSKSIGIEYNGYFSHKGKEQKDAEKKMFFTNRGISIITIKEYKKTSECQGSDFYIHERTDNVSISKLVSDVLLKIEPDCSMLVDCNRDQTFIKAQYIDSVNKNSIAEARPEIMSEWDYEKNGDVKPEFVGRNSKLKYYWICPTCGYSYLAAPTSRFNGTGCPACAGKVVQPGFNDLQTRNPEIVDEWDYDKNGKLDPSKVFYRASTVVWWKCKEGHSWQKSIYSRTYNKSKCPYCTGRQVLTGYNDLQTVNPEIASEWDYELNETTPNKVHYNNQTIQAHWICRKCGYKWVHSIKQRDRCPECLRRRTQINVYNAIDQSLYGEFENARSLCEHFGMDYNKNHSVISNVCRRKQRLFIGMYILRHPIDDEFAGRIDGKND